MLGDVVAPSIIVGVFALGMWVSDSVVVVSEYYTGVAASGLAPRAGSGLQRSGTDKDSVTSRSTRAAGVMVVAASLP